MNMNPLRANVDHPIKHKGEDKGRFELHRLTQEEREKLGVAAYYRPYRVDHKAVLKDRRYYWKFKRAFDVVCALLALVVLSPVMLLTMLAIFIEDPHSSPIFKQVRIGRGGRIFIFYNLRWMKTIDNSHRECAVNQPVSCMEVTTKRTKRGFRHQFGCFKLIAAA